jgi:GT2 family glycosyltransferase
MTVSVIMTVRGEPQERVDRVLAAIAAQVGDEDVEVVVALPHEDRARLLLPAGVIVVDNPTGGRSAGLNLAAAAASGEVLCRVDARSLPPADYVARTAARLAADPGVGVVGGQQRPRTRTGDVRGRGIARALGNPWALGGASYRRADAGGSVDTVYLGTYRRDELLALGFDERLDANEDFELCQRYRHRGLQVWLEPGLVVDYEARTTFSDVWRQYLAFGRSKVRFWRTTGGRANARQRLALGGAAVVAVAVAVVAVRRPGWLVPAAVAATGAVALGDAVGAGREADPRVRVAAWVAYVPIVGGWVSGVVLESLTRSRASALVPPGPSAPSSRRQ